MSWLVASFERLSFLTDNAELNQEIKRNLLKVDIQCKVAAVASAIFSLIILNYAIPAFSLLGTAVGGFVGVIAYDCWKISTNIHNDTSLPKGISSAVKIPEAIGRNAALKKLFIDKAERVFKDTLIARHIVDYSLQLMQQYAN